MNAWNSPRVNRKQAESQTDANNLPSTSYAAIEYEYRIKEKARVGMQHPLQTSTPPWVPPNT
jgi:hypothetical protein